MAANGSNSFGIRDNHSRGKVADFIKEKVAAGSKLSVVSAYFTIYAYEALSAELDQVDQLHFLFGEPRFIASLDPDKTDKKAFKIEDEGLELANRLQQKEIARRCAAWIRDKVEIRSVRQAIPIEMPFKQSSQSYKAQELLDKLANWKVKGRLAKQGVTQKAWDDALHRLRVFKDVVMNPYSHPSAPNIPKQEVADAITAVTEFLDLVAKK